jgi:hypothetical protein
LTPALKFDVPAEAVIKSPTTVKSPLVERLKLLFQAEPLKCCIAKLPELS